jgi:hypothetical protein
MGKTGKLLNYIRYKLQSNSFAVLLTLLLGVMALLAIEFTEQALFAGLFLITAFTAVMVKNLDLKWLGVETATFGTVILAMTSSPAKAALVGFTLISVQMIARQQFGTYILWVIPSYAIAGALISVVDLSNVFLTGLITTIGLHTVFVTLTGLKTPNALSNYIPYAVLNIAFNAVLFKFLASPIMGFVTSV